MTEYYFHYDQLYDKRIRAVINFCYSNIENQNESSWNNIKVENDKIFGNGIGKN